MDAQTTLPLSRALRRAPLAALVSPLHWAAALVLVALAAAAFGYGSVASVALGGGRMFAWVFVAVFAVGLVAHLAWRGR